MENNETIHERISQLVDYFGNGKNTMFAKIIGDSEANVRGYMANVIPKHPFLEKIVRTLDVSPLWLLTGNGPMLRDEQSQPAPTVLYERDPRDVQLIAAQEKTIARDERLIAALEQRINDLEKGSDSKGFSVRHAEYSTPPPTTHHPRK